MQGYWVPFVRAASSARVVRAGLGDLHAPRRRVRRAHDDADVPARRDPAARDRLLPAARRCSRTPATCRGSPRSPTARSPSLGLNGRAVIPLILGLGCVTMGTLTTRILGSKRERFIATALMAIAVPCSAQIAVIAALMTRVGPVYAAGVLRVLLAHLRGASAPCSNRLTPGHVDRPADRPAAAARAAARQRRAQDRREGLALHEGGRALLPGRRRAHLDRSQVTGALDWIQRVAAPLTVGWLGLPAEAATAFVMGFVRRDFGAAGFFTMNLTDRAAARGDGHDHAVRAVHRGVMVIAEGARLAVPGSGCSPVVGESRVPARRPARAARGGGVGWAPLSGTGGLPVPALRAGQLRVRCPRCDALKVSGLLGGVRVRVVVQADEPESAWSRPARGRSSERRGA